MELFGEAHKALMKKNSESLRERLLQDVAAGPKSDNFGEMRHAFNQSLLHAMNTRKVVK